MIKNRLDVEKLNRFFKGEYSVEDKEYLKEVFNDSSKADELEHHFRKHWYELLKLNVNTGSDKNLDHILYRIHYEMNTKEAERKHPRTFINFIKWSARIAAILLLPLLVWTGIYFYRASDKGLTSRVEIKALAWTRAQFSLPDGTTGWLNSSSSLKYDGNFSKDRKVDLSGEAFFDVIRDEKRPFIVNTEHVAVTVLGTRFNIASYENEKDVEVVLEDGKLIFNNKEMNRSYTMNPNELVVYDKSLNDFSVEEIQPQKYVSWTEGKLVFRNDPLDVVARRLERWYNVEVEISGDISRQPRLRATFIDENLEEVLYFLKRSLSIDYRIEDGRVRDDGIYSKKKVTITNRTR